MQNKRFFFVRRKTKKLSFCKVFYDKSCRIAYTLHRFSSFPMQSVTAYSIFLNIWRYASTFLSNAKG